MSAPDLTYLVGDFACVWFSLLAGFVLGALWNARKG